MEITTSWHEKGRQEGRVEGKLEGRLEGRLEGKLEGRLEGRQEIFIKLSEKRFGVLPPDILNKIKDLSVEQLDILAERLLEVASLDELRQALD